MSALSFPVVVAALVWLRLKAHAGREWRSSLLEAVLLFASGTLFGTELLGWAHLLRPAWVSLAWVFAGAAGVFYLWRELRRPSPVRARVGARVRGISFARLLRSWTRLELVTVALVLGATAALAWLSPPTNYDSMTYNLARIMHWFQQGTLEHYPTANIRQLAYGPGAAYWQVQLWSVFGGDAAANLAQWAALVGSGVGLTLWIQRFVDWRAIGLAVITGITLPMALLQACSTQTDLQVGCWLLIAAAFLSDPRRMNLSRAGFCGLAIGLAVVTKPSAVLCAAPLAAIALWRSVRVDGVGAAVARSFVCAAASVAINLPHFTRNFLWFGHPLGSNFGTVVESLAPKLSAANGLRWIALNVPAINAWRWLAHALQNAGVDPNHPAITFTYSRFWPAPSDAIHRLLLPDEDFACYTGVLILIGMLALATRLLPRVSATAAPSRQLHSTAPWLFAVFAALILYFVLLKWQWWGNRLLLPWALLGFPLFVALTGAWRHPRLRMWTNAALLLQAGFVLVFSLNRPVLRLPEGWKSIGAATLFSDSRTHRFYTGYNASALPVCRQLVAAVAQTNAHRVGLFLDENYPEYVLWRALRDAGFENVELYHVNAAPPPNRPGSPWPPPVDITIRVDRQDVSGAPAGEKM